MKTLSFCQSWFRSVSFHFHIIGDSPRYLFLLCCLSLMNSLGVWDDMSQDSRTSTFTEAPSSRVLRLCSPRMQILLEMVRERVLCLWVGPEWLSVSLRPVSLLLPLFLLSFLLVLSNCSIRYWESGHEASFCCLASRWLILSFFPFFFMCIKAQRLATDVFIIALSSSWPGLFSLYHVLLFSPLIVCIVWSSSLVPSCLA